MKKLLLFAGLLLALSSAELAQDCATATNYLVTATNALGSTVFTTSEFFDSTMNTSINKLYYL